MKLTAKDLLKLGVIDEIISEPVGGAHRDPDLIASDIKHALIKSLNSFKNMSKEEIYDHRKTKFLKIGRDQGFNKSSNLKNSGLNYQRTNFQNIKENLKKYSLIYLGVSLMLIAGLLATFF